MVNRYTNPILNEREETHGNFSITAQYAQGFKDIIKEREGKLSPLQKEALDMISSKMARILCGNVNEPDHWRDIAGYAELVATALTPKNLGEALSHGSFVEVGPSVFDTKITDYEKKIKRDIKTTLAGVMGIDREQ